MKIICDPVKRERTLAERGFDLLEAEVVFAGETLTLKDDRFDYGERRFQTYGLFRGRGRDGGLDAAWRGPPRHFHEALP